ncbi:hypothetical protein Y694_03809 [Methylibium sp. T29-B]|uniref:hypothetical protein n=2 Tax=unclassified Methylibium TaxID=2633235 RepID=UPI0003F44909|nr:hypothetical protein [Methylibium sp. T29-B]EWS58311.1 hypothetical protein Y694_03809 [Methylibium sp. T29-B]
MPKIPIIQSELAPTFQRVGAGSLRDGGGVRPVDPSGLVRGVADAADAYQQAEFEQSKVRATEKIADAQLEWTRTEIDRRNQFDPSGAEPYTEKTLRNFDDFKAKLLRGAAGNDEARILQSRLAGLREGVLTKSIEFEADARSGYRRQTLTSTLGKRAATAEIDPAQALDLIAQQVAEIDNSDQLSVLERNEMREQAKGSIAYAAALSMAGKDPAGLRESPLMSMVPAEKLPTLLKVIEKSDMLMQSQDQADEIMARKIPLGEAMQLIEKDYQGEHEKLLKTEVMGRYAYAEATRRDHEEQNYGTALLEVEQTGKVSTTTWGRLSDTHRAAVLNRQQAEARQRRMEAQGQPVKTNWDLYLTLRQQAMDDPQAFTRTDLKQYVDKIGPGQMEQLLDLKGKTEKAGKAPRDAVTLSQQMNATMQALGIKRADAKGKFLSYVQSAVDDATQAKGKPLGFDERQKIIDEAVLQGPDPDAWLWGQKRMFELTPDQRTRFTPNAPTDAPATELQDLNEALKAQGLPQTPANRLALYKRVNP